MVVGFFPPLPLGHPVNDFARGAVELSLLNKWNPSQELLLRCFSLPLM